MPVAEAMVIVPVLDMPIKKVPSMLVKTAALTFWPMLRMSPRAYSLEH